MNNKRIFIFLLLTIVWSWTFWIIGLDYLAEGITQETIGKFLIFFSWAFMAQLLVLL